MTPDVVGNAVVAVVAVYVVTVGYSVYSLVLNYRQAKVKDLVEESNTLLRSVREELHAQNIVLRGIRDGQVRGKKRD